MHFFLIFFAIYALSAFIFGLQQCRQHQAYTLTPFLNPLGAFVWGDAVVFGLFWFLVSLISLLLQDWLLFWLIFSVFWLVRSFGEMIYWFNQQFSAVNRNPPEKLWLYQYFKNDSIWFVYQIFWQCILVITIISTTYLFTQWLE